MSQPPEDKPLPKNARHLLGNRAEDPIADADPQSDPLVADMPCNHIGQRRVDIAKRVVTCGACGSALDPIWCLQSLIDTMAALRHERELLRYERKWLWLERIQFKETLFNETQKRIRSPNRKLRKPREPR